MGNSASKYGVVPKGLFTFLGFFFFRQMRSLVPGRDFRSSMNSGSQEKKKKFAGVFVTASDDFLFFVFVLFGKKLFVLSPFG